MSSRRSTAVLVAALAAIVVTLLLDRGGNGHPRGTAAKVVGVVGGDTIRVARGRDEEYVRMLGIDTPETHRPGVPIECGGPQASRHLEALLPAGTAVTLERDPGQDRVDRYGRLLAYVRLAGGGLAEDEQGASGGATGYGFGGRPGARDSELRGALRAGRGGGGGGWGARGGGFP